jgi:hypothetical protein
MKWTELQVSFFIARIVLFLIFFIYFPKTHTKTIHSKFPNSSIVMLKDLKPYNRIEYNPRSHILEADAITNLPYRQGFIFFLSPHNQFDVVDSYIDVPAWVRKMKIILRDSELSKMYICM